MKILIGIMWIMLLMKWICLIMFFVFPCKSSLMQWRNLFLIHLHLFLNWYFPRIKISHCQRDTTMYYERFVPFCQSHRPLSFKRVGELLYDVSCFVRRKMHWNEMLLRLHQRLFSLITFLYTCVRSEMLKWHFWKNSCRKINSSRTKLIYLLKKLQLSDELLLSTCQSK